MEKEQMVLGFNSWIEVGLVEEQNFRPYSLYLNISDIGISGYGRNSHSDM